MSRARTFGVIGPLAIGAALLLPTGGLAQTEDDAAFGARLDSLRTQAMAASRDLSRSMLPSLTDLEPGWRYPWEVPSSVPGSVPSEDEYWQRMDGELGPSGIPEEDARRLIELYTRALVAEGADERTANLMMLHLLADTSMAPYETMLHSFETGARLLEEIRAARDGGGGTAESEDATAATERFLNILDVPFQQMTDAQLNEAAVRESSDIDRLTEMSYFTSNDWTAVPGASDDELKVRGVWVGTVTVRLMLVKEDRVGEIEDPDVAGSAALQGRLSSAYARTQTLVWQERERELDEALESAHAADDQERIAEIQEQIPRERTAVLGGWCLS